MAIDITKIGEILRPGSGPEQAKQAERVRASFFETLRRAARHVPFVEDLVASYYCAMDPQTPMRTRGVLLAALAYFVLPADVIPDFIIGLGFTDDVAVLWAAFHTVSQNIKPAHYVKAREALGEMEKGEQA